MTIPVPHDVVDTDGRTIGVYEYGDPKGAPVIAFHGTPACGAGFAWADAPARARGIRVIAPDRPGVGRSTRQPSYTVHGYAVYVTALLAALGIDHVSLWGYSGGGPYAVACAAMLPVDVRAVVVSAGMGQVGVWADFNDFEKTDRQMLDLATRRPWQARLMLGTSARLARLSPKSLVRSFEKQMNASDRAVIATLGTPAEAIALFTRAFTHGAHGVVDDYIALSQPWGVAVEGIRVPMRIFHGDDDQMVPMRHSEELAKRVPESQLTVWPGAGHLGTIAHVEDILDALR